MKFLTIFLLVATALCAYFWHADGPGSGMNYATLGLATGAIILLIVNKARTGSWLSDNAMGR